MVSSQQPDDERPADAELPAGVDWARIGNNVSGPLLTMAIAIVLDLLTRAGVLIPSPFSILLLGVVVSALRGGLGPGFVSALIAVTYGYHFLSEDGQGRLFSPENFRSLVVLGLVAPAMVLAVGLGRRWHAARIVRGESDDRRTTGAGRAQVLAEAGALLSRTGALEHEAALERMVRLIVPPLADWASLHLAEPGGRIAYLAGAHRDPGRELLVQGFAQQAPPMLARAVTHPEDPAPAVCVEGDDAVRLLAADDDAVRRVQALEPAAVIAVPLLARGRAVGLLVLARTDPGRAYDDDDLRAAEQLGAWAAFAVDHARLAAGARAADHRARLLFEGNPQPMWVFDVGTLAFLAVNDAAVRVYGYERDEFLSMTVTDLRPEEDPAITLHPTGERFGGKRGEVAVTRHQKQDGTIADVEIVSHEVMWGPARARLVMVTDISDRARQQAALQQSEEQLRQAQKMDAVGRLASGIAHDFNNLLTAIQGYSEMMLRDAAPDDPRRRDLDEIRRAADRGALLTRQLLAFSRRQLRRPKPVNVNRIVSGMETLLQRLVGADVQVATVLEPGIGRVMGDPAHVEQILMNLVLNARDAMPRGGMLTIETAERYIGPSPRHRHLRPGRHLLLTVSDTGSGLDEEPDEHLFDPAHGGRPAGGTGLGLSIVYGIVRQSGGAVRVSSEPGQGTTVRIYLPVIEDPSAADTGETPVARGGPETVLLVEDEESVRELLRKVLARQGYTVLEARHGRDALLVAERHAGRIDLVLTDVVMPEMGGRELVAELRGLRPEAKVLYISGYTNDEVIRRGIAEADGMFIQKPFSSDELVRRVRELLDSPAPPRPTEASA